MRPPSWTTRLADNTDYGAVSPPGRPVLFRDHVVVTEMMVGTVAVQLSGGEPAWTKPFSLWIARADADTAELTFRCPSIGSCRGDRAVRVEVGSGRELGATEWSDAIVGRGQLIYMVDHNSGEPTGLRADRTLLQPRRGHSCSALIPFGGRNLHVVTVGDDIVVRTPEELSRMKTGSCSEKEQPVWRKELTDSFLPAVAVAAPAAEGRARIAFVHGQKLSLVDAADGKSDVVDGRFAGCTTCLVTQGRELWGFEYTARGIELRRVAATAAQPDKPAIAIPGASVMGAMPLLGGVVVAVHLDTSMTNDALVYARDGQVRWAWRLPPPRGRRSAPVQLAGSDAGLVAFFDGRNVAFWESPVDATAVGKRDGSTP